MHNLRGVWVLVGSIFHQYQFRKFENPADPPTHQTDSCSIPPFSCARQFNKQRLGQHDGSNTQAEKQTTGTEQATTTGTASSI